MPCSSSSGPHFLLLYPTLKRHVPKVYLTHRSPLDTWRVRLTTLVLADSIFLYGKALPHLLFPVNSSSFHHSRDFRDSVQLFPNPNNQSLCTAHEGSPCVCLCVHTTSLPATGHLVTGSHLFLSGLCTDVQ